MSVLARLSNGAEAHDDGLGDHEGQFGLHMGGDALGVNDKTISDVVEADEDGVGKEESLGDVNAADGGVVEGALHPLVGVGVLERSGLGEDLAGEGVDALRTHGVSLVSLHVVNN